MTKMAAKSALTLAGFTPVVAMAHSGEHTEGVLASILHSLTSIDHLWVVVPAVVVISLSLRKVLRAQKK